MAAFLLPLRGYLGITYVYAAYQKFHDPGFLDPAASSSFAAQTAALEHVSPIGFALGPAHDHALVFGLLIAFGELATGLGTLLGLWTRVAAIGGAMLALTFFLTVSWNMDPYYYGSDLGFAFGFLTLALAGASRWSLDAWLALPNGDDSRRLFLKQSAATGITGGVALLAAAGVGKLGRSKHVARAEPRAVEPPGTSATPSTILQIALTAIPATGAARLTAPDGDPVFVARTADGGYKACSGICTHAGCPVGIDQAKGILACPCHGSTFDPKTGDVITGPAKDPLPSLPVTITDGVLHVRKS